MNRPNRRSFLTRAAGAALVGPLALGRSARAIGPIGRTRPSHLKLSIAAYSYRKFLQGPEKRMDLFDFGDRDGNGDAVRLQHPLGLTRAGGVLFIADTYNHKIKTLNPVTGDVRTFAGSGVEGHEDGAAAVATFYEPGGLSATSDALFVADTNNHAIRRVRLTDGRVETLELSTSSK